LDTAEMRAVEVAQELVVVAWDVDHARALARLAQELLHDVVVGRGPVPVGTQRPAVDDVADEVDGVRVVVPQKVEQAFGLTAAGAEVHVGNEQGTKTSRGLVLGHHSGSIRACPVPYGIGTGSDLFELCISYRRTGVPPDRVRGRLSPDMRQDIALAVICS